MFDNLIVCLNAIVPMFLVMLSGFGARRAGFMTEKDVLRFNKVAFNVFCPAMVIVNLYRSDLSKALRPGFVAFALAGVLAEYLLGLLIAPRIAKDPKRRSVLIQAMFRTNLAILGVPLVQKLMGKDCDMGPLTVLMTTVVPLYNVLAVVTLESMSGEKPRPGDLIADIFKNPLIMGTLVGIGILLLRIRLPDFLYGALSDMADVASPLMIFLLGAFFDFRGAKDRLRELSAGCFFRLVLFPGIFMGLAALLGFRGMEFVALFPAFGTSVAVGSFTMSQQLGGDAYLAGDLVIWTSILCIPTIFLWMLLFKTLGLF